jgi:nucleotide-binding universal stress UspA family protein
MDMEEVNQHEEKDKHFLVAVDGSESSKRAVIYVADLLGSLPGFSVTLFSIIPAPEKDFFEDEEEGFAWIREKTEQTERMLDNYRQVLVQSGFPEDKVNFRTCVNDGKSLAELILTMRCDLTCCTVVVGRHHKSRTEEFLFGSTSSKLIHEAKNCAVWVVE